MGWIPRWGLSRDGLSFGLSPYLCPLYIEGPMAPAAHVAEDCYQRKEKPLVLSRLDSQAKWNGRTVRQEWVGGWGSTLREEGEGIG